MKVERKEPKLSVISYKDMNEFYSYLCDTPFNEAFRWATHKSVASDEAFTGTKSFEEAVELMKNGWQDMARNLTNKLKAVEKDVTVMTRRKTVYDVAGYQCSVPRFLQGLPNSMVRTTNVPVKQKVITVVKNISYSYGVKKDEIIEESIKAMAVVKKLEAQGYRVNVDIILGTSAGMGTTEEGNFGVRVRVKGANERLNVSKLAFPLVNPSMLRRLMFRWIEVYPEVTKRFVYGYGRPWGNSDALRVLGENEYLIPAIMDAKVENIRGMEDLLK